VGVNESPSPHVDSCTLMIMVAATISTQRNKHCVALRPITLNVQIICWEEGEPPFVNPELLCHLSIIFSQAVRVCLSCDILGIKLDSHDACTSPQVCQARFS
jgi:hypothetical protein